MNNVLLFPGMNLIQMTRFCRVYERILRFEWRGARFIAYADLA